MHGPAPAVTQQPIVVDTWREKYRYRDEADYAATCRRVVGALAARESELFRAEALQAMVAGEVIPGGRVLAGAGTDKRVTLINCFVSPDIQDSLRTEPGLPGQGIMEALAVASSTQQMGGGIGMDFSTLRPRGAVVKRTQSMSSGVVPFMEMWNAMCATIMSAGSRRGAMMGVMRCDHPDIEEFIAAKQTPGRLTNFNVSVLVTDAFMRAVEEDHEWDLVFNVPRAGGPGADRHITSDPESYLYKRVSARELWNKITDATYVYAEPGVVFIDRVNALNNLSYCENIHACNPCGEQFLPPNGDCCLGHVNLAVMVDDPFEPGAALNCDRLTRAAAVMVRLLDNVLDVTLWPTEEQAEEARSKRRIGLGFTGLASALQQLGIPYGSEQAVAFTEDVGQLMAVAAYQASCQLARERGSFPLFDADKFCEGPFVKKLDEGWEAVDNIRRYGIRNGVLLSIAPTGTTSLVLGNVSSGVEPVFAHSYRRRVREASGDLSREYTVYDYGYLKYCQGVEADPATLDPTSLPAGFVTAGQLTVEQHLQMAAAAQSRVDSAVSKTINCPESMTVDEFRQVYTRAYDLGMKGCTTYRPDPRSGRGAVLIAGNKEESDGKEAKDEAQYEEASAEAQQEEVAGAAPFLDKVAMRDVVEGRRYRIKWPSEDCSYYVIITDYQDEAGRRRPFELFISTKSERHSEWVKAFSLLVTAIFRRGGDPSFVVDELRSVFAATGSAWVKVPWQDKPQLATSLVAAVGLKIEEHMRWLGLMAPGHTDLMVSPEAINAAVDPVPVEGLAVCNKCGARGVVYAEGCSTCCACGASDCG